MIGFKKDLIEITDEDVIKKSGERFHPVVSETNIPSDEVEGVVFDITKKELLSADQYEVSDYKRVSTRLKSGKVSWVYVKSS